MGSFDYSVVVVFVLTWGVSQPNDKYWSYFVFTQQWPQAACIDGNATKHDCQIPPNVTTWTIHGLWPSDPSRHDEPVNCNSTWKFDERQILTLEDRLKKFWPNLYVESPTVEFWSHEWEKHGTCCTNLTDTADEHKYFSQGLLLNNYYNLTNLFEKNNMFPGNNYTLDDFNGAISSSYSHKPIIQCVLNKTKGQEETQYIYQIEICLDKAFQAIECPKNINNNIGKEKLEYLNDLSRIETGICSSKKPVQYLRIQHP